MTDQVVSVSIDTDSQAADIAEAKLLVTVQQDRENGAATLLSAEGERWESVPEPQSVAKRVQYTSDFLLGLRKHPNSRNPPQGWDERQFSELFEPAFAHAREGVSGPPNGPAMPSGPDYSGQQRKDSWRGRGSNVSRDAHRDGPIRSRLVHDGYLNEAEPPSSARPAGATDSRAYQEGIDPGRTTGPPSTSGRPARIGGRKDNEAPEWWGPGSAAPGGDSWRGAAAGSGRGRGSGPTAPPGPGERQWMGRGGPPVSWPVEIPGPPGRPPGKVTERESGSARSLETDWRSGKQGPSVQSLSSKEWMNGHPAKAQEGRLKRPPGFPDPQERQRASSRNPEWMADGKSAPEDGADGLTAAARKAKDFEAERQRMKEEWKREQAQRADATKQVSAAEMESHQVLEQLKEDSNAEHETMAVGEQDHRSTSPEQPSHPPGLLRPSDRASVQPLVKTSHMSSQETQLGQDRQSTGSVSAAQAFSFNSLAQAAGLGLRPMPKGVTRLEDLEQRHSGNLEAVQPNSSTSSARPESYAETPAAAASAPAAPAAQVLKTEGTSEPAQSPFAMAADPAGQQPSETGKALLNMLSNAPSMTSARSATISPPPGFVANKTPSAISWGSSGQLQGIWGAPTAAPGSTTQSVWGPPSSSGTASVSAAAQQGVHPSASQQQLWAQQPQQQPHLQPDSSAQHLEQGLSQQPQGLGAPFATSASTSFITQQEQLARAQQARQAQAIFGNPAHAAGQLQLDGKADPAQNPLLALLGRHNAAAAPGPRGEHDAQLQAFLQAQTSHYSWHPPASTSVHQLRPPMPQQRVPVMPPQLAANAALSQDLLRQLQLGQTGRQNAAAPYTLPQQQHQPPSLQAYQQSAAHLQQQPQRGWPPFAGQLQHPQLQANTQYSQQPQYSQQHQLPYSLNGALQQSAYRGQPQTLQNLGIPGHGLPLGGAGANAHSPVYADHHQHSTGQQAFGSSDLAARIRLQQIQNQQLRYAQPQQRQVDLNALFSSGNFRAPAAAANMSAIPNMQLSVQELEAMMARQ